MNPTDRPRWLKTWDEVATEGAWDGLLIGNGASLALWPQFQYESLYSIARQLGADGLTDNDERIFGELSTHNFERVLLALRDARHVNRALELDWRCVEKHHASVRRALAAAVAQVHIPWASVPKETLQIIRRHVADYKYVFSTNYDLLLYWAVFGADGAATWCKDYFWTCAGDRWRVFNPADTSVWNTNVARILYLHGGLHLYHTDEGTSGKLVPPDGENLLDAFYSFMRSTEETAPTPLFVSEGTADDKRASIASSDYLSFAFRELIQHSGGLVIFGHSLGKSDTHIVEALNGWKGRRTAISLRGSDREGLDRRRAHYENALPTAKLRFFDAQAHPLALAAHTTAGGGAG